MMEPIVSALLEQLSPTMIVNTLLIVWAVYPVPFAVPASPRRTAAAIGSFLVLRILLGFVTPIFPSWLQPTVKLLPTFLLLLLWQRAEPLPAAYFTFLVWVSFTACSNILHTPLLTGIIEGTYPFTTDPQLNHLLTMMVSVPLHFVLVTLITRIIPLKQILRIGAERLCLMGLCIGCELYITYTLSVLRQTGFPQLTAYLAILQIFLLGGLVLFEKYLASTTLQYQLRLENLSNRYRYDALLERQTAEQDLRRLHHDMKNHLLALRRLSGTPDEMERYISSLVQELSSYEQLVRTGCSLLDGLLTEKLRIARKHGIELKSELDFRSCTYMEEIDICSIFGNALDNAIEACSHVDGPRVIELRSIATPGQLIVSITNPSSQQPRCSGERYVTSKRDTSLHGFGLSSIRRSLARYGGTMTIDSSIKGYFTLNLFIPTQNTLSHS